MDAARGRPCGLEISRSHRLDDEKYGGDIEHAGYSGPVVDKKTPQTILIDCMVLGRDGDRSLQEEGVHIHRNPILGSLLGSKRRLQADLQGLWVLVLLVHSPGSIPHDLCIQNRALCPQGF